MNGLFKSLILLFSIIYSIDAFAQDTILLFNGKQLPVKLLDIKNNYITYEIKKKSRLKVKYIETEEIFAIYSLNRPDSILYQPDSIKGFFFTKQQMQDYINGEQFALNNYKTPKLIIIGGCICGTSIGIVGIYGLLVPVSYTTAISSINPKSKSIDNSNSYFKNEFFIQGYKDIAKSKNIKNSILSAFTGILITTIAISTLK